MWFGVKIISTRDLQTAGLLVYFASVKYNILGSLEENRPSD